MSHEHLSPQIVENMEQSERDGGVWMKDIPPGKNLIITTKNTTYLLEHREDDGWYLSGNARFCPSPKKASIHGSTWGSSMLKMKFIGVGMHLEFSLPDFAMPITTSTIEEIEEVDA